VARYISNKETKQSRNIFVNIFIYKLEVPLEQVFILPQFYPSKHSEGKKF